MNKIYKVIWSKTKNCYIVASELAKSHTKAPKSSIISRTLVAGVLACVLSCGAVLPNVEAAFTQYPGIISTISPDDIYFSPNGSSSLDWTDPTGNMSYSIGVYTYGLKTGDISTGEAGLADATDIYNNTHVSNGNFINANNSVAQNLTALDNAIAGISGSSSTNNSGAYLSDGYFSLGDTNGVYFANINGDLNDALNDLYYASEFEEGDHYSGLIQNSSIGFKALKDQNGNVIFKGGINYRSFGNLPDAMKTVTLSGEKAVEYGIVTQAELNALKAKNDIDFAAEGGYASQAVGYGSTALGLEAKALGDGNIAIGNNAGAVLGKTVGGLNNSFDYMITESDQMAASDAVNNVSIGTDSFADGNNGIAIGTRSWAVSDDSVAVGHGAVGNAGGIAIGKNSYSVKSGNIALGDGALADSGNFSILLSGDDQPVHGNVALGADSVAPDDDNNVVSVGAAVGDKVVSAISGDIKIVNADEAFTRRIVNVSEGINDSDAVTVSQLNDAIAGVSGGGGSTPYVGVNSTDTSDSNYDGSGAEGTRAIALGVSASATGTDSVAIGTDSSATRTDEVSIGSSDKKRYLSNVANGTLANDATNVAQTGSNLSVSENYLRLKNSLGEDLATVALTDLDTHVVTNNYITVNAGDEGEVTLTVNNLNIANDDAITNVGTSTVTGENSTALGTGSTVTGVDSIAVGTGHQVSGSHSGAFGDPNIVDGSNSYVIGNDSSVNNSDTDASFVIGNNSRANKSNTIILGSGSEILTEDSMAVGQSNIIVGEFNSTTQELSDGYNNSSFGNSNVLVGSNNTVVGNNNAAYYLSHMVSDGDEPYYSDPVRNNKIFGDSNYVKSDNNLVFGNNNYVGNVRTNFNNAEHSAIGLNQDVIDAGGWEAYRASCVQGLVENSNYTQEDAEAYVDGRYLLDCYPSLREEDLNAIRNGTFTEPVIVPSNNNIAIGSNINISKYRDDVYNAIAIGNNSVISGKESIAIGNNAVVSGDGSIALGTNSEATEKDVLSVGSNSLKRRIVNVDAGVDDTDAVNVSQLNEALAGVGSTSYTAGNHITIEDGTIDSKNLIAYDSDANDVATMAGTRGTKLTNLKQATLSRTSSDAVIGAQLWQTNMNIEGFANDIRTNATNITNMNTAVTNALSSVAAISTAVDTVNDVKADISLNNLSDTGRQMIASAAANAVQEYMRQNGGNGGALGNNNTNLLGGTNTLSAPLTRSFGLMVNPMGNDDIVVTNNDDINGGSDISMEVQATLDDKANISLDNINDAGISVIRDAVANDLSLKADIDSVYTKDETDSFLSEKADITFVNDELSKKADITYIDDKLDTKANKDSVYTKQETDDFLSLKADKADLNKKADVDGNNIDVNAWSQKLATGEVAPGNTGLVNGGAVFNSMMAVAQSNPVQVNDSAIFIGKQDKYDDIRMIDVSNSKGEGRVMTGVITNPEDKSSVANVGYVNAVGDNIIAGVNGRFAQMNNKISEVGANAAAMSGLVPYSADGDEKWALSAAVGHYDSSTAGAVGLFYKPSNNVVVNVKGTVGSDENMLAGGVTVALDKGSVPGVTKKQMVQTINSQANEIQQLKEQNKQRDAEMEQMRQQMALMMQEIQKQKSENIKK